MGAKRYIIKPPIPSLFLSFLLIHNQFSLFFAAIDTLTAGQCIRDGANQTLVSHGGIFELGFFSPSQSKNRYIGTWYHGLSTQEIVWVANRVKPVNDSSGILCLVADGDLVLSDHTNATIWSTNLRMKSNSVIAMLLDSGNLILSLRPNNESYQQFTLWESFYHPSDTYLPGMRAGLDLTTGTNQLITSWKNEDDPSVGHYSIGVDPRGLAQMFIWEGLMPKWRSGLWNGQRFLGMPMMLPMNFYGFKLNDVVIEKKIYFSYAPFNFSLTRFVLRSNGVYEQMSWDENQKRWNSTWYAPVNECETYNKCGEYAICNDEDAVSCSCLPGFEPKVIGNWSGGNWSGGCVRSTPLQCDEKEDRFVRVDSVKLPDSSIWIGNIEMEECKSKCLMNCSCEAYSYANGIGCLVWGDALLDMQQFVSGGEGIYVRVFSNASATNEVKVPSYIIAEAFFGLILLILTIYVLCKYNNKSEARKNMAGMLNLELCIDRTGSAKKGKLPDFPLFSLQTLATATNDFHLSNKLGQGGFGPVYKGKLPSSQEIAVKRLSKSSGQGIEEFKNEVNSIAKVQHKNLVKLLGCCIEGGENILVYEYMPNGSLDAFLFDPMKKVTLDWKKRLDIIGGIARGLLYLHRDSRLGVVHRDLKSSNILLDENMNPKISDFGMAKIFGGNQDEGNTTRVAGTFGYMAPEYTMEGHFSVKSDVYSFGVLLLEIISGERNGTFRSFKDCKNLLEYAWKIWQEDRALDFMDATIVRNCQAEEILKCIHVGLLCVQDNDADRPTMAAVVYMLGRETTSLLTPKKPRFSPMENVIGMVPSTCHLYTK